MKKIRRYPLSVDSRPPVYGLGILTDEPGYRLCWLLNQTCPWELAMTEDLSVTMKNSSVPQNFACFKSNPASADTVMLISNRSKEGVWLTAFEQVDFFLITSSRAAADQHLESIRSTLSSKIPQIRGLFKVPLPSFCYL
jgi:hypothetical protein